MACCRPALSMGEKVSSVRSLVSLTRPCELERACSTRFCSKGPSSSMSSADVPIMCCYPFLIRLFVLLFHLIHLPLGSLCFSLRLAFCPFRLRTHLVAFHIFDRTFRLSFSLLGGCFCLSFHFLHR